MDGNRIFTIRGSSLSRDQFVYFFMYFGLDIGMIGYFGYQERQTVGLYIEKEKRKRKRNESKSKDRIGREPLLLSSHQSELLIRLD